WGSLVVAGAVACTQHPRRGGGGGRRGGEGAPAKAVEERDVAQVVRVDQLFQRERRRQEPQPIEPLTGGADLFRDSVAVAERRRQIRDELVVDEEGRRGQRLEGLVDALAARALAAGAVNRGAAPPPPDGVDPTTRDRT